MRFSPTLIIANILLISSASLGAVLHADTAVSPASQSGDNNTIAFPNTSRNVAVDSDGVIYVVYRNDNGIWVTRSTDRGETFLAPVKISTTSDECEITVDVNGVVYVVWANGGAAYLSRSTDGGATFSAGANIGASTSTVHIAVDAPYVYVILRNGTKLLRNTASGVGTFTEVTVDSARAYADVHVDPRTHYVYVQTDDPNVYVLRSTDYGATFSAANAIGQQIYYSTTVLASTDSGLFLYTAGNGSNGLRTNLANYSGQIFTFATTSLDQGRTLAVDANSNVIDGYVDNTVVKYAVSTDNGETFDTAVTIATAAYLSLGINSYYGDIVAVYESGGQIYCTVYAGEIAGASNLTLNITSPSGQAAVNQNLTFGLTIQNTGTIDATNVVLRVPLPANTEFVSASRETTDTAATVPLEATVDNSVVLINLGTLAASDELKLSLVLKAKVAGSITLQASLTSSESSTTTTAQANTAVTVEDGYYRVTQTFVPYNFCGILGMATPFLIALGIVGMRRRFTA